MTKDTRQDLRAGAASTTRQPLTPIELLQALDRDLARRGLVLTREAVTVEDQGQGLWGVLDVYRLSNGAYGCAVALRYAPEARRALHLATGLRLHASDHLLCTGDRAALTRPQLLYGNLPALLALRLDRCLAGYVAAGPKVERLRQTVLTLADAQTRIYHLFLARLVPRRLFQTVTWTYAHLMPVQGPTLWTLHQACVAALQGLPPARALRANVALGQWFLQRTRGQAWCASGA